MHDLWRQDLQAGKPLAITFIFTRCPIPEYCPRFTDNFAQVVPRLKPLMAGQTVEVEVALDRVEAGVTVVASRPTVLPFDSQVDELTSEPAWPHVHVEVIDPSIPDIPTPGGGC